METDVKQSHLKHRTVNVLTKMKTIKLEHKSRVLTSTDLPHLQKNMFGSFIILSFLYTRIMRTLSKYYYNFKIKTWYFSQWIHIKYLIIILGLTRSLGRYS
jgi:hypothetical protein